jgi:hypothetical protein
VAGIKEEITVVKIGVNTVVKTNNNSQKLQLPISN